MARLVLKVNDSFVGWGVDVCGGEILKMFGCTNELISNKVRLWEWGYVDVDDGVVESAIVVIKRMHGVER